MNTHAYNRRTVLSSILIVIMNLIELILLVLGIYLLLGLIFGLFFLVKGIHKIDETASDASLGFKLIILPGITLLWPIMFFKWSRS